MDITRRDWAAALAAGVLSCGPESDRGPLAGKEAATGLATRPHVIDLHCDTPMLFGEAGYDLGKRNDFGEVDLPRLREGGVSAVFFSVYTSARGNTELEALRNALEIIDTIYREVARFPDDLVPARSSDDLESARSEGRIAVLLGVEGGHMIASSLAVLRSLQRLGARYLTLTHSVNTPWAGSSASDGDPGLSDFGREVVAELNRLGMMVDVSHVSDQTFWDALESSSAPLIASHSSARALCPHKRNLTDAMIRAAADKGGVVHINYYNRFIDPDYATRAAAWDAANPDAGRGEGYGARTRARLAAIGRASLDTLLDHFEHVAKVGGVGAVGLGSDFDGVDGELPEGMEDVSKVPAIADGLSQRGFSSSDVEKVLGLNTLRVLRDVERAAEA